MLVPQQHRIVSTAPHIAPIVLGLNNSATFLGTTAAGVLGALAIPIVGYIYSPFELLPDYAFKTRFIFLPAMALSGLWMWKGHLVRRLFAGAS